jgi:transcriptional regulator with XRE-family HTH domain
MSEYRRILREEFRDEAYRYAYAEDFLNTLVATQIKVLREQRKLTQGGLADLIGTKQAGISRLENVNYSAWKTETLRKLARALGVRLRITFETFGSLLDESAMFSPQSLERSDFSHDPAFGEANAEQEQHSLGTIPNQDLVGNTHEQAEAFQLGSFHPAATGAASGLTRILPAA